MGTPSIKLSKVEKCYDKMAFMRCKLSRLNAPGTALHWYPLVSFISGEFSFLLPWGNKNGNPQYKAQKGTNCWNKIGLMRRKWSRLNAPGTDTHWSHSFLEKSLISCRGAIKMGTPSIKLRRVENCLNKMGLIGCKRSSLNPPGTDIPLGY